MAKANSKTESVKQESTPEVGGFSGSNEFCVVGIGASAGGLFSLEGFFDASPEKTGMAFVIVQHLAPDHKTHLPELLAKRTGMNVLLASDGITVEPDNVYIIPPDAMLTIEDGKLHTETFEKPRKRRMPIDTFLRSLARDKRECAIGIILSGSGNDGTVGIKDIKEFGGMAIAQTPETAGHDSMPRSAIKTGLIDFVLPPDEMPGKLQLYDASKGLLKPDRTEVTSDLIDNIGTITAILDRVTGHDFREYKRSTLARRIQRRIMMLGVRNSAEYIALLRKDTSEVENLFRDFLISVTHFFRDPEAFRALASEVVPILARSSHEGGSPTIRVWVPGCATGEEAYSIAMLLLDYFERHSTEKEVKIFATDIDLSALEIARQGVYPEGIVEQVPERFLSRFFTHQGHHYKVGRELRDAIVFSPHNLLKDPPFSRLDLISCRNLLIYLQTDEQKRLMHVMHYALRGGGFLFLGSSESIASHMNLFRAVDKKHRISRQNESIARSPVSRQMVDTTRALHRSIPSKPDETTERIPKGHQFIERIVLREFAPSYAVIDDSRQILFTSGNTSDYLELPEGNVSTNIVDMARRGLRLELRSALYEAFRTQSTVSKDPIILKSSIGTSYRMQLTVRPIREDGNKESMMLILFDNLGPPENPTDPSTTAADGNHSAIVHLEEELRSTREQLQTTIEELETTNEELKSSNEELLSMNEELQSSNEELQTSKEEIQSINEELATVNTELNQKVEELNYANTDLQYLLHSTHIPTIFVGGALQIKRFTPEATQLFRIIDSDIDRLIGDVRTRFIEGEHLEKHIREVIGNLIPYEREVSTPETDASYIMKILPYRTISNVIDGVVITFLDITNLRRAEADERYLKAMFEYIPEGIMVVDADTRTTKFISREGYRMLGRDASDYDEPLEDQYEQGMVMRADGRTPYDAPELPIARALQNGETVRNEKMYVQAKGRLIPLITTAAPVLDDNGRIVAGVATWRDITDFEEVQKELSSSNERFRIIASELESLYRYMPIGLSILDEDLRYIRINKYMADVHGIPIDGHIGKQIFELMPELEDAVGSTIRKVLETGDPELDIEVKTPVLDGEKNDTGRSQSYWHASYFQMKSGDDTQKYVVSIVYNITQRREAQLALEESRAKLRELNDQLENRVQERTEQVRSLSAALALAERSERRRLSFLLHDDLQQILFGLEMKLQLLQRHVSPEENVISRETIQEELRDLDDTLLQAVQVTRTLSVELNPPLEHDSGVEAALRWIVEHMRQQHGLEVELEVDEDLRMPNVDMRALMVQLVRELLFNVVKHSGGLKAQLRATSAMVDCITITVVDQGIGFDPESLSRAEQGGLGLFSIRERVSIVGGNVQIDSAPGKGTSITVTLPASL